MGISRKCNRCGTWTVDNDRCSNCGNEINFEKIKRRDQKKQTQKIIQEKGPDQIERFLNRFKNSRFILVKGLYYLLYSVWFVLASIVSFFMFLTAMGPG